MHALLNRLNRRWLVLLAVPVVVVTALAFVTPTNLSIHRDSSDRVWVMSSTGRGAELPMSSTASAGLMSSSQARFLHSMMRQHQDDEDDVVTGGHLVIGESLTLTTALGKTIVVSVAEPTPPTYAVYWARATATSTADGFAALLAAGGADVQSVTTTALASGTQTVTLTGLTTTGTGYSVCAYPTALGGQWVSYTGAGFGGPCGAGSIGVDVGTATIAGVEYRIWRGSSLQTRWFDITFTLVFEPTD